MKLKIERSIHVSGGGTLAALMAALGLLAVSSAGALADGSDSAKLGNPDVAPPVVPTHPYGLTYAEWAAKYWQWALTFPANADPAGDTAPPDSRQSGDVWFLAAAHGTDTETRSITVPPGKALFFPVLSVFDDNTGCPNYNNPLLTASELGAQVLQIWDSAASQTTCTIDGTAVEDISNPTNSPYLIQSEPFGYTLPSHDNLLAAAFGEPCIPNGAKINPVVAEGIFLMVAPLPPGQHTIHFVGVAGPLTSPFFTVDITYNITVGPDHGNQNDHGQK